MLIHVPWFCMPLLLGVGGDHVLTLPVCLNFPHNISLLLKFLLTKLFEIYTGGQGQ